MSRRVRFNLLGLVLAIVLALSIIAIFSIPSEPAYIVGILVGIGGQSLVRWYLDRG